MKKHLHKTARHDHYHKSGLGYYGSPHYSPYCTYTPVVFFMHEVPCVAIQKRASLMIVAGFTGRIIKAI
jgi:hypothetical protein